MESEEVLDVESGLELAEALAEASALLWVEGSACPWVLVLAWV